MKIPNGRLINAKPKLSLARIVSEDSQRGIGCNGVVAKSSKDS